VFENGLPAFDGQLPIAPFSAQGISAFIGVTAISVCVIRFHKRCHPYGGKKKLPDSGRFSFRTLIDELPTGTDKP
jgi:hypothetical protein